MIIMIIIIIVAIIIVMIMIIILLGPWGAARTDHCLSFRLNRRFKIDKIYKLVP